MKLLQLTIQNIRGIKELKLEPNGQNLVIWGPNGSGKSAVVDAVEFLLTGGISRLSGQGTSGITLKRFGPHIDHKPKESVVTALVQIHGLEKPVELRRSIQQPGKLEYPPECEECIGPILKLATKGQQVLSRREILKYIHSESGRRSEEIMTLLNLIDLESIRRTFVTVANKSKEETEAKKNAIEVAEEAACNTLGVEICDETKTINEVNKFRKVLALEPVYEVSSNIIVEDISPSEEKAKVEKINPDILRKDIDSLLKCLSQDNQIGLEKVYNELCDLLEQIRKDEELNREFSLHQLLELGVNLIEEDGRCPLCLTQWRPNELRKSIEKRITQAERAKILHTQIKEKAMDISIKYKNCIRLVDTVVPTLQKAKLSKHIEVLSKWRQSLLEWCKTIEAPFEKYQAEDPEKIRTLLAPNNIEALVEEAFEIVVRDNPKATSQDTAVQTLIRLSENIKAVEKAIEDFKKADLIQRRASILLEVFDNARSEILDELYNTIEARFTELYKVLHSSDEENFVAELKSDGAKLNFEVDFYGRGRFPPLALHSEGHQDTMGLCLYLALAEYLTGDIIHLIILDDVVMSVDAGHRRHICTLLSTMFPDKQFLITTHDKTWATQLQREGVIPNNASYEFSRWSLATGPLVYAETDLWQKIAIDLDKNDIPSAASRLRRGTEQFFEGVCDALEASIPYRSDGRWEFSHFLNAGVSAYKKLLKEVKNIANSWGNKQEIEAIQERESIFDQIWRRTNIEQWAVNPNVHYNNWVNFTIEDFRPVVDAFRDLFEVFICQKCRCMLKLASHGVIPVSFGCKCGAINFTLQRKSSKS